MNSEGLLKQIEDDDLLSKKKDEFSAILREQYNWDPNDIKKIISFGVDDYLGNILVDRTVAMQYMAEIKSMLIDGFQNVLRQGPLCGEKMRGVIFRVTDAKIHEDPSHRGASQITPIASNGCRAAFLASEPRLMEPIFICTIKTEETKRGDVYTCIGNRRGRVIEDEYDYGKMITIKAYLPVAESFGFTTYLRDQTGGTA